ncbi:MAG: FG-GAP repeat protein [Phycisphaerales bacterium]
MQQSAGVVCVIVAAAWAAPAPGQCEIADLWAADGGLEHFFGRTVGISDDLNTIVIGAPGHNTYRGAVYIYVRTGSDWIEQAIFTAPDPVPYNQFGRSVAISADGRTVVIGEVLDDNKAGNDTGAAFVFGYDPKRDQWLQRAKLLVSDAAADDAFGLEVALTPDGVTAVVTALGVENDKGVSAGAAYVFERPPEGWTDMHETFKLTASDQEPLDVFGKSVAVSPGGRFILIGDQMDYEPAVAAGAAYVFGRAGDGFQWIELQKLMASDAAEFDNFGRSVAVSLDAATIVVGAKSVDDVACSAGAAYVFVRQADRWIEQAKIYASDGAVSDRFGWSADISDDGNTALIGNVKGTAYLFSREEDGWVETARLTSPDENVISIGKALDMLPDASAAVLGAPNSKVDGTFLVGSAHVFDLAPTPGDLDCNGVVGASDLLILLVNWGPCDDCKDCPADLDGDCIVGASDLLILLANWG